jgi:hypothetical protein
MTANKKKNGQIIIPSNANVWPHELLTAKSLAAAGSTVEFVRESNRKYETSADCFIEGERWEFKAPRSGKISAIEDNLKKASKQADKVVFDSRRMHRIPDKVIERELRAKSHANKSITSLKFVDRHGKVIDIK